MISQGDKLNMERQISAVSDFRTGIWRQWPEEGDKSTGDIIRCFQHWQEHNEKVKAALIQSVKQQTMVRILVKREEKRQNVSSKT